MSKGLIQETSYQKTVLFETGGTVKDILKVIFLAHTKAVPLTPFLAKSLKGRNKYESCANIWSWVKDNIRYKVDEAGFEIIKSPAALQKDGYGDCKSFSLLIGSCLENLGIPFVYRVTFYDPATPNQGHIYPVALIEGEEVIVDAVHDRFDDEVPYWKKTDYNPKTGRKTRLSGVGSFAKKNWLNIAITAFGLGLLLNNGKCCLLDD